MLWAAVTGAEAWWWKLRLVRSRVQKDGNRGENVSRLFNSVQTADNDDDYLKSVHDIYVLCDLIRKIISWEAIAAFVSLSVEDQGDTGLFIQKNIMVKVEAATSGGDDKSILNEKKQQKEKKKSKVVMGKGTTALMQFLKDRMQALYTITNGGVEKWADSFLWAWSE